MGSTAIALVLAAATMSAGAPPREARASVAPEERDGLLRDYRIPAGSIEAALNVFADRSGLHIVYDTRLTEQVTTPGVAGLYSVRAGLDRLLSGTGLSYRLANDGRSVSIILAQAGNVTSDAGAEALPTIDIGAETGGARAGQGGGGAGHGSGDGKGYAIGHASTGTKTDTPLMDTPLNIQTISPQVLKDRQITSLPEALKNVSGVTFQQNAGGGWLGTPNAGYVVLRGFQSQITYRNGFRNRYGSGSDNGFSTLDFANIDRIEVLKGSSSILYGMMEPGGLINVVTKKPLDTPYASVQQQIGNFAFYRTSVDATGPIDAEKSLLYRLNFSYENAGSFVDLVRSDSFFIAPALTWRPTEQTEITLEAEWKKAHEGSYVAVVPVYDTYNVIPTPRSRNYGEYSPFAIDQYLVSLDWTHKFDADWKLRHHTQYFSTFFDTHDNVSPYFALDDGTNVNLYRYVDSKSYRFGTFSTVADLTGHFETGPLKHRLLVGGDFYRYSNWGLYRFPWELASYIDLLNPAHPGVPLPLATFYKYRYEAVNYDYGVYAQDQIELPYGFHLLGGLRYQATRQLRRDITYQPDGDGAWKVYDQVQSSRVTPRVGALWRPVEWLSVYGNYAEGYGANTGLVYPNTPTPPTDARQIELGAKMELFEGRVQATAAYYNLTKTNVTTGDLLHPGFNLVTGEVRTKGPELDIQGEILPGWDVIVTYANTEAHVTKDSDQNKVGARFWAVPRNTASFWSSYEVQDGDLRGLKFGGGVTYRDASPLYNYLGTKNAPELAPYATVDIMGSYSFDLRGTKVTAQLNVDNLLDHTYYTTGVTPSSASFGWSYAAQAYGAPRMFKGSIKVEF